MPTHDHMENTLTLEGVPPSTWEAEAGGWFESRSLRPVWIPQGDPVATFQGALGNPA